MYKYKLLINNIHRYAGIAKKNKKEKNCLKG